MIISKEHRYVFVELPRTGSTAIRKELLSQYGGSKILHKHSTYHDFLKVASPAERRYLTFSTIRNPLDDAVSHYFKLATDHNRRYSDPNRRRYRLGNPGSAHFDKTGLDKRGEPPIRRSLNERLDNRRHDWIVRNDADFAAFFRRFHLLPYDNWTRLSHRHLDFVVRFEHLQDDFSELLRLIGLEQTRPLPTVNKTTGKPGGFLDNYTAAIIPRAKRVYGPYLRRWGYDLPAGWGQWPRVQWEDALFHALGPPRSFYWRHLRRER